MRHKFTIYLTSQFDPIILEVESFMWTKRGDLELYDKGQYWFFSYKFLEKVEAEVIK